MGKPRFCVLGAGHGGTAMAAHLALMGFEVNLWNRSPQRLEAISELGAIELLPPEGGSIKGGEGKLRAASTDCAEVVSDADLLMVVIPATGHEEVARRIAPSVRQDQIVVLNPGRTGGALAFRQALRAAGCESEPLIAETQTFIYASRVVGPAQAKVFAVKNSVSVAALPAYRTGEVLRALREAYSQFVPTTNVLRTSLGNVAVMFHPAVMLMNAARIEDTHGDFEYYLQGITPSVARYLEAVDNERVAVAEAMGLASTRVRTWLYVSYDAAGRDLHEAVHSNPGYKGIMAPPSLAHRYLLEDVPTSLIPMISLGEQYGVEMPTMQSIVHLACQLMGLDFWSMGRTVKSMGVEGLSVRQLLRLVNEGEPGEA
jgi:opine dehydrogenase